MTYDAIRAQYRRNLASLRAILAKAEAVAPRKYRGATVEEHREHVATFERLSTASDSDLAAWLAPDAIRARVAALIARRAGR